MVEPGGEARAGPQSRQVKTRTAQKSRAHSINICVFDKIMLGGSVSKRPNESNHGKHIQEDRMEED